MWRFVDLTDYYWLHTRAEAKESPSLDAPEPCCAFLDTVTDRFLEYEGAHVFTSLEEVREGLGRRAATLIPLGFFEGADPTTWGFGKG